MSGGAMVVLLDGGFKLATFMLPPLRRM